MKKPTLTRASFESELHRIAAELHRVASFRLPVEDVPAYADQNVFVRDFFSIGVSSPAPSRARGERTLFTVGWIWWPSTIDESAGAALVTEKLRSTPGIEQVGDPALDPQFRLIWQLTVVVRSTQ